MSLKTACFYFKKRSLLNKGGIFRLKRLIRALFINKCNIYSISQIHVFVNKIFKKWFFRAGQWILGFWGLSAICFHCCSCVSTLPLLRLPPCWFPVHHPNHSSWWPAVALIKTSSDLCVARQACDAPLTAETHLFWHHCFVSQCRNNCRGPKASLHFHF